MNTISFTTAVFLGLVKTSSYDAPSYWYSSTLSSDGNGSTSYDSTYRASYSYDSSNSDVHTWNYSSSSWDQCPNTYCGSVGSSSPPSEGSVTTYAPESYWYSSTLSSDGNGSTSYDYTYRASYSYDSSNSDVHTWNYSSSSWDQCPNTYCGASSTSSPPDET